MADDPNKIEIKGNIITQLSAPVRCPLCNLVDEVFLEIMRIGEPFVCQNCQAVIANLFNTINLNSFALAYDQLCEEVCEDPCLGGLTVHRVPSIPLWQSG